MLVLAWCPLLPNACLPLMAWPMFSLAQTSSQSPRRCVCISYITHYILHHCAPWAGDCD